MYAFIDESGDTGKSKNSSKNFILVAIIVEDGKSLDRLAKKVFSKKVKYKAKVNQLHANKDTENVHKAILKYLKNIDYSVVYINQKDYYSNLSDVVDYLKLNSVNKIYLSKRETNKKSLMKINSLGSKYNIEIEQSSPTKVKGLQIADFISWSIFRFVEHNDDFYFTKLANIKEIKTKP